MLTNLKFNKNIMIEEIALISNIVIVAVIIFIIIKAFNNDDPFNWESGGER